MIPSSSDYYVFDNQQCTQFLRAVDGQSRDVEDFLGSSDTPDSEDGPAVPIANSQAMRRVVELARRYADTHATILLTGESGTGKEVLARFIHRTSRRSPNAYVRVNCAALSETLIESELFGHERGAFTGADRAHAGRFESAGAGTLLLDEISEIPLRTQAKLLRALEEEEFQRVGSSETLKIQARIIATSNRDLQGYVAAKEFRADLYYRLDVLHLHLPALRERREDIPALVGFFIQQFGTENPQTVMSITHRAMQRLIAADWPGNIRQLRNVIHRSCILARNGCIDADDLIDMPGSNMMPDSNTETSTIDFMGMRLEEIERHAILSNLRRFDGNKTATARHLGVTSRTLANKMKRYREMGWL